MSACVWQAQKHNGRRNTNVRLLRGCYNAAHAVRSSFLAFVRKNKKRRCGACTASQRHCLFHIIFFRLPEHTTHEEGYNANLFE